jgi:hypothetical protein
MERHPTDFIELLFGLGFLAAGASFVVDQTTDRAFDPAWIAAIALVGIGCAFLAVTLIHRPRREPAVADAAGREPTIAETTIEEPVIDEPAP